MSRGQWTHHAPVDPGITLLEFYASQLEQRLFWADQFLPQVKLALLRLAGMEPEGQKCSRCVMVFEAKDLSRVGRHTLLTNSDGVTGVRFRTVDSLEVLAFQPTDNLRLMVDGSDLSQKLTIGALPPLVGKQAYAVTRLELPLCKQPQIVEGAVTLSVYFEIAEANGAKHRSLLPVDSEDSKFTLCQLQWSVSATGSQSFVPLAPNDVSDGTFGFRRSGIVKLTLHQSVLNQVWNQKDQASACIAFRHVGAPIHVRPRIRSIYPNAVIAEHRQSVQHSLEEDPRWKKLPGNTLPIPKFDPENPPIAESICLKLNDGLGAWKHTSDLTLVDADSNLFQYDPTTASLHFGNGINGRIPKIDSRNFSQCELGFDCGGGPAGNVRNGLQWEIEKVGTEESPLSVIRNVTEGIGGLGAESLDDAGRRTRIELRRPSRTVTRSDFEQIAMATPVVDIARAFAAIGLHPKCPMKSVAGCITVFIVPNAVEYSLNHKEADEELDELIPDHNTLLAVHEQLQRHRLLTQEVHVEPVRYRPLSVLVYATNTPHDRTEFEARVRRLLQGYLHPIWGGPECKGWPFGGDIFPSELLRVIQESHIASELVKDIEIEESGSRCSELKLDAYELALLKVVHFEYQNDEKSGGVI